MAFEKELIEVLVLLIKRIKKDPFEMLSQECKGISIPVIEKFFIKGFDRKDYWQEADAVLYEAVEGYDDTKGMAFSNYYRMRIENRFTDILRKQTNDKRKANNLTSEWDETLFSPFRHKESAPEEELIVKEAISEYLTLLSPLEKEVLSGRMNNESYEHLAKRLNCSKEKAQHAMYRARKKLRYLLSE